MNFKCKMCGGQLEFNQGDLITICPYCGSKQSLPRIDNNEKVSQLYTIANAYLMNNEFDKAERLFLEIVSLNPNDPEGYWQLVMCKYGVTYVTDSDNGQKVPTVNRTYYSSILDDANYLKAISLASAEQKNFYEKTAGYINNVQNSIVSISRKEKPYDIFICYKETDSTGERTEESIRAQELYYELTNMGYKVFFARITLENKIGSEYEPYIFAALTSSKIMLCIGSSKENFEAVWVKNEWSRYLRLIQNGEDKTIIPVVINNASLPEEFANIAPQGMNVKGFVQELIRGIRKIIPTPVEELARRKRRNKILRRVGIMSGIAIVIACVLSVPLFKKNAAYNSAAELYNSKKYAQSAWAFHALGDFKDSKEKANAAEISWRKSVADIADDTFAYAKSAGFERLNSEASRHGAYVDPNGNIQEFYSKGTDTTDDIDAVHGKVCSIIGSGVQAQLYDDGYLYGAYSILEVEQEIADDVIQAFKTCEGYVYLKKDGTVGAKSPEDGGNRYLSWEKITENWSGITKLVYYNDARFNEDPSEVLIGIKADGTVVFDGYIGSIDMTAIDFSHITNVVDADITINYFVGGYPSTSNAMFAFILSDGKVNFYNVPVERGNIVNEEIVLNDRIVDCAFSIANNTLNLLCADGYVYGCNLRNMNTYKMNIGGSNVYVEPYMAITKNGEPHFFSGDTNNRCLPSSFKARIYDEFSERID